MKTKLLLLATTCVTSLALAEPASSISAARMLTRAKVLASDEFEGRAPGTPGEEKTVAYLAGEFKQMGLEPGNPDGTYFQNVPLVGITSKPSLTLDIGGKAMLYYGRWMYKYEIAAAKGAAACLIVHETGPASYPIAVVIASNSRENFELRTPDGNAGHVAMQGWLTLDAAQRP